MSSTIGDWPCGCSTPPRKRIPARPGHRSRRGAGETLHRHRPYCRLPQTAADRSPVARRIGRLLPLLPEHRRRTRGPGRGLRQRGANPSGIRGTDPRYGPGARRPRFWLRGHQRPAVDRNRFPRGCTARRNGGAAEPDRMSGWPTPEQLAEFDCAGFLVIRGFFEAAECTALRCWTEEIATAPELPGRHMVYYEDSLTEPGRRIVQRIENMCPFYPGFDTLLRHGRLNAWARALLWVKALLFKDKINFKPPGSGGFRPPQDPPARGTANATPISTSL